MRPPPMCTLFPYTTLFRSESVRRYRAEGISQEYARYSREGGSEDEGEPAVGPRVDADRLGQNVLLLDGAPDLADRSEEHTSELQSLRHLVCRLLLEKKKKI